MQRVREFSAERNELSRSRLNQSRRIGPSSNMGSSRVQKYQIATPKSNKPSPSRREFHESGNLSGSRISQKSSSSEYICTGCFNHSMGSDKKQQRRMDLLNEKERQRMSNQFSLREDHEKHVKQGKLMKDFNDVKQYNKRLIEQKQKSKLKQMQQKNQMYEQQKTQSELYLNREKEAKIERQKANEQLLKDIQEQINYKKQNSKETQHQSNYQNSSVFGPAEQIYFKEKAQKEQEYRQDLLKQIQQREVQIKNEQFQKSDTQNMGMGIAEAAYQREIEREKRMAERQQSLLQEAKRQKELKQVHYEENRKTQVKLEQQRLQLEEQKLKMEKKFSSKKKGEIQTYLHDIEKQIEAKKKKRQKQAQQMHELTRTSIEIVEKVVDRKNCKSCDKKFTKTFLTKLK